MLDFDAIECIKKQLGLRLIEVGKEIFIAKGGLFIVDDQPFQRSVTNLVIVALHMEENEIKRTLKQLEKLEKYNE